MVDIEMLNKKTPDGVSGVLLLVLSKFISKA